MTGRWYWWLFGAAAMFGVGLAALAIDTPDDLSTFAWATWMLSWASGAVLAVIGVVLGVTRIAVNHRSSVKSA